MSERVEQTTEIIAKFLEDFCREIDKEARDFFPGVPMIDKGDETWMGFLHDAGKLRASLLAADRIDAEALDICRCPECRTERT